MCGVEEGVGGGGLVASWRRAEDRRVQAGRNTGQNTLLGYDGRRCGKPRYLDTHP